MAAEREAVGHNCRQLTARPARYRSSPRNARASALTNDQIHAAALEDPDAQPLTPERLAAMRQTPRLKIIRRALGLTREEFAARFQIPLGTLRDWEQGAKEPDQAARAYLRAIAGDPDAVHRALHAVPQSG
jgi:putative transcriptional regulator